MTGKVFDVLLVLVENPSRLLTKSEPLARVWHEEFVEEGNLARNVSTLRKAIGDTGKEHRYILTVQGQRYRFIGEVVSVDGDATPLRPSAENQPSVILDHIGLAYSPDGTQLYFSAKPKDVSTVTLYRLPLSGGDPPLSTSLC